MAAVPRHRVLNGLRIGLALLVTAAVTVAVVRNWSEVSADLRRVDGGSLALASAFVAVAPILTMLGWRRLLADLGSDLHVAPAGGIFFVGQLGKYLPGSVWSIVAQAEMAARLHIPRSRSAVVGMITLGLAAICGFVVGLPALPLLLRREGGEGVGWLLLALPLVVVLLWPPLLNWGIAVGLRLLRREPLEHNLSGRAVLTTAACFIGAWIFSGLHAWVLVRAIGEPTVDPGQLVVASVCGFALASSLAMFSVVLPAGVGVREGLLVLILAPGTTSTSAAAAVVVLSRFLTVLADVVFALAGWAYARSHHLLTNRAERAQEGVVLEEDAEADSAAT
ncbi:MAG TPA: lysylphosphatidylglycerol synthase transmembrane domain-containing protein [Pedococcus sp.]|jgi:hypothetical protein|uniref:lysylphosphatidylglycerol synthase transmembrane domain-containing protein n=1 Tax=Pedococcus sp. TaxID=2860345 RepID=UPI002F94D5B0